MHTLGFRVDLTRISWRTNLPSTFLPRQSFRLDRCRSPVAGQHGSTCSGEASAASHWLCNHCRGYLPWCDILFPRGICRRTCLRPMGNCPRGDLRRPRGCYESENEAHTHARRVINCTRCSVLLDLFPLHIVSVSLVNSASSFLLDDSVCECLRGISWASNL